MARFHFDEVITEGTEFNLSYDEELHKAELDPASTKVLEGWVNGNDVYMKFNLFREDRLFILEAYIDDEEEEDD